MIKVHILTTCEHCLGKAYLPAGETEDCKGEKYTHYKPCPACSGSGKQTRWVDLKEFATLLKAIQCPHEHTSYKGSYHLSAGELWDDITEVCDDCGEVLS